jgi:hypothetical protein
MHSPSHKEGCLHIPLQFRTVRCQHQILANAHNVFCAGTSEVNHFTTRDCFGKIVKLDPLVAVLRFSSTKEPKNRK